MGALAEESAGGKDLAAGTGGDYRYLVQAPNDEGSPEIKAIEIAFLRSDSAVHGDRFDTLAWDAWTTDINEGRGGDYLYLVWRWSRPSKTATAARKARQGTPGEKLKGAGGKAQEVAAEASN